MTPEEKAKQLIKKFQSKLKKSDATCPSCTAKQLAIICVKEILAEGWSILPNDYDASFYETVRYELEQL